MAKSPCVSEALMNRLYDGDLPQNEQSRLKKHIERCPACREHWDALVQGERFLEQALAVSKVDKSTCYDEETLAAYVDESLPQHEMDRVREHVSQCSACNQLVLRVRYLGALWAKAQAQPTAEAAASQVLHVLSRLPDVADRIGAWVGERAGRAIAFVDEITLPCFEPHQLAVQRLAAETGEGYGRQGLHEPDSPFDRASTLVWSRCV